MVVRNNETAARYELDVDGRTATVSYRRKGDVIVFIHTEVPPELQHRAIAVHLIAGALEDVRSHGWKVRAICPFVVSYIERHPEVHELLAKDAR
jgi:predicted GNAT family acetyltransferase